MSDYTLILGDCLDKMSQIEDGSVDAIIADLPYQQTNCAWDKMIPFEPLWTHYKRVIKRNGAIALTANQPFSSLLVVSNLDWFRYEWIWDKRSPTDHLNVKIKPMRQHENILIFSEEWPNYNPQYRNNVHRKSQNGVRVKGKQNQVYGYAGDIRNFGVGYPFSILPFPRPTTNKLHPTQKSVPLLSYLIRTYTNEGETVLDNTMGSGSTGEACLRTNRRFIGIEKDAGYFEIASNRLARVAAELRGEFVPKPAKKPVEDLPMFAEAML